MNFSHDGVDTVRVPDAQANAADENKGADNAVEHQVAKGSLWNAKQNNEIQMDSDCSRL